MNDPIVDKFVEIEREIASEKGDFVLFALLEREERPGRWDVVAAAPWLGEDKRPALDYIIRKIDSKLSREERGTLSRVVLLDPSDAFVVTVNRQFAVADGAPKEIARMTLGDVYVTEGYILKSAAAIASSGSRQAPNKRRAAASART